MAVRLLRYFIFFLGLTFFGLGNAIAVNVQNVALFQRFGFTIGTWSVICGLVLVLIAFVVDRKYISIGTFLNALSIGPIMDFFLHLNILPHETEQLYSILESYQQIQQAPKKTGLFVFFYLSSVK
ncbi:hypothetical protein SAMN05878482_1223 [Peribacillus simplex]|uniref:Uncharacterized protein n=1 Tax=Peribacillus simplex TaxID=1478 RepID=A0A9X8RF67_9BACI|nr:hypothetical protein SAMN05878482_1223 [Peribacillus simplex]